MPLPLRSTITQRRQLGSGAVKVVKVQCVGGILSSYLFPVVLGNVMARGPGVGRRLNVLLVLLVHGHDVVKVAEVGGRQRPGAGQQRHPPPLSVIAHAGVGRVPSVVRPPPGEVPVGVASPGACSHMSWVSGAGAGVSQDCHKDTTQGCLGGITQDCHRGITQGCHGSIKGLS